MQGSFRRDLELAPGPGFRLRRRPGARTFSILLAVAALGWGVLDLDLGRPVVGVATLALAVAFGLQILHAELDSWRFEGDSAVLRHLALRRLKVDEVRLRAQTIRGVHIAFAGKRARAWIETRAGEEYALVEGNEREVRRIADRLDETVRLASLDRHPTFLN